MSLVVDDVETLLKFEESTKQQAKGGGQEKEKDVLNRNYTRTNHTGANTHRVPLTKWSIFCMHMQLIHSLNSCWETHSCTPHQMVRAQSGHPSGRRGYSDHYISFIFCEYRKERIRLFPFTFTVLCLHRHLRPKP